MASTSILGGSFSGPKVNYLGLPQITFGEFQTPIPGLTIPGWSTDDLFAGSSANEVVASTEAPGGNPDAGDSDVEVGVWTTGGQRE